MSNVKIFTAVLLASALAGAAYAYAGPGGGGRRDNGGRREPDIYVNIYVDGVARHGGRPTASHYMTHRRFGGRHVVAVHARPEVDERRGDRISRNRHEPAPKSTAGVHRSSSLRPSKVEAAHGSNADAPRTSADSRFSSARAQIVTNPATVGDRRSGRGSRHRNGGLGWGGPASYVYNDIYDYALWGDGYDDPSWDYGYGEIYSGMFTPHGRDEAAIDRPQKTGAVNRPPVHPRPRMAATAPPKDAVKEDDNLQPQAAVSAQPKGAVNARTDDPPNPQPQAAAQAKATVNARADDPTNPQPQPQPRAAISARPKATVSARTDDPLATPPRDAVNAKPPAPQAAAPSPSAQMCGEDSRDIAGLPIDRIQVAIKPNEVQRAALDDLGNASVKAAEIIRTACPTEVALTAPARLAAMQQRVESMISAVDTILPVLRLFNDLLSDEQKARLNAVGNDPRRPRPAASRSGPLAGGCDPGQKKVPALPSAEIEARIHPTEIQRQALMALRDATARAADMLNAPCPTNAEVVTPPARLEAVRKRLDLTKQSITLVLAALDDFYGELSEEQKAEFEAMGVHRPAAGQPGSGRAHVRPAHVGLGGDDGRLTSMAQQ